MSRFTDVLVSVQVRGEADPRRGHLATGLLVAPDVVMVPAPTGRLTDDPATEVEVLLAALPSGTGAERIAPTRLTVLSLKGARPRPFVGYLLLARATRHRVPAAAGGGGGSARLADGDNDLWPALERAGFVPRGFRGPSRDDLGRLRANAAAPSPLRRQTREFTNRQSLERGVCDWVKVCDKRQLFGE